MGDFLRSVWLAEELHMLAAAHATGGGDPRARDKAAGLLRARSLRRQKSTAALPRALTARTVEDVWKDIQAELAGEGEAAEGGGASAKETRGKGKAEQQQAQGQGQQQKRQLGDGDNRGRAGEWGGGKLRGGQQCAERGGGGSRGRGQGGSWGGNSGAGGKAEVGKNGDKQGGRAGGWGAGERMAAVLRLHMIPGGSVKERAALYIIKAAEASGELREGGVIVEGTAGNAGIGMALVANARGYKTVIVIPETQSQEKKDMLRIAGATLVEVRVRHAPPPLLHLAQPPLVLPNEPLFSLSITIPILTTTPDTDFQLPLLLPVHCLAHPACGRDVHACVGVGVQVPAVPYKNPNNYVKYSGRLAQAIAKTHPGGAIWGNQLDNTANRQAHYETTGPEIWTEGRVDAFICAIGTGGTLAGTGKYLKERKAGVRVGMVDPMGAGRSYYNNGTLEAHGSSISEGIGQGRITGNLQGSGLPEREGGCVDFCCQVEDAEALPVVYDLLRYEGLCVGLSSGINVAGAMRLARAMGPGHTIVTVLCDLGTRYQGRLFNPPFLTRAELAQEVPGSKPHTTVCVHHAAVPCLPRPRILATQLPESPMRRPSLEPSCDRLRLMADPPVLRCSSSGTTGSSPTGALLCTSAVRSLSLLSLHQYRCCRCESSAGVCHAPRGNIHLIGGVHIAHTQHLP
ncbi:unnamed protein product [Closterium sp. NIES-65]|nr:unnamed protein product [Closterium sp. NIES-65]